MTPSHHPPLINNRAVVDTNIETYAHHTFAARITAGTASWKLRKTSEKALSDFLLLLLT